MNLYFLGQLSHGHRVQFGCAMQKKVFLFFQNFFGDPLNGILPLLNRVDQELTCPHLVSYIFLFFGRECLFGDEFLVGFIEAQAGHIIIV